MPSSELRRDCPNRAGPQSEKENPPSIPSGRPHRRNLSSCMIMRPLRPRRPKNCLQGANSRITGAPHVLGQRHHRQARADHQSHAGCENRNSGLTTWRCITRHGTSIQGTWHQAGYPCREPVPAKTARARVKGPSAKATARNIQGEKRRRKGLGLESPMSPAGPKDDVQLGYALGICCAGA